jgi:hypothetical protein
VAVGCRTCGTLNPERAPTCAYCGASLPSTPIYRDAFRTSRIDRQAVVPYAPRAYPPLAYTPAVKDPSTGLLVELLPGLFGFMGIGYLWAGKTALGLVLLLGYWCFWAIVGVLTVLTLGLLLCFFPFFILLYFAAPIVSALLLQKRLRRRQAALAVAYTQRPY